MWKKLRGVGLLSHWPIVLLAFFSWLFASALLSAPRCSEVQLNWSGSRVKVAWKLHWVASRSCIHCITIYSARCGCTPLIRCLQLGFDCDSTAVRLSFDCSRTSLRYDHSSTYSTTVCLPAAAAPRHKNNNYRSAWVQLAGQRPRYITVNLMTFISSRIEVESKSNRSCNHRISCRPDDRRQRHMHLRHCALRCAARSCECHYELVTSYKY